jgi:hypothetical protein
MKHHARTSDGSWDGTRTGGGATWGLGRVASRPSWSRAKLRRCTGEMEGYYAGGSGGTVRKGSARLPGQRVQE